MTDFDARKEYVLENDAVLLRPLEAADHAHLLHFALHEPDIWKYSLVDPAGNQQMKDYIQTALKNHAAGTEYPFIVFDKTTDQYAGSTRFYDIQPQYRSLQLGYTWYGKSFQGTKLNKNCKLLLLELAFEKLNMRRVEFRADNDNEKSKAAMKSIGCTVEGVLRNHLLTHEGKKPKQYRVEHIERGVGKRLERKID